jgi:hypothetical protein
VLSTTLSDAGYEAVPIDLRTATGLPGLKDFSFTACGKGCIANRDVSRTVQRSPPQSFAGILATPSAVPARLFPFPLRVLEALSAARKLTRSLEIDDSAVRQDLDWRPRFSLEQGLRATAGWYRRR